MNDDEIRRIAAQYGTPLYLYDGDKIQGQYQALKDCLPPQFEIFYSVKANPLLGICQFFKQWGAGIEIASSGELHVALVAGFKPEDIIFTSPGKTDAELESAVTADIYCINIESLPEAEILNRIAAAQAKKVRIALRINPDFNLSGAGIKMTGVASQFGIDQRQLETVLPRLQNLSNLDVAGIHIYTGTQILEANQLLGNLEEIIKLALQLADDYQLNLESLDLGGGFGIPYFKGEVALNLETFRLGLAVIWEKYRKRLSHIRMAVESGRFLMAESGVYLTKILYHKECKGNQYLVCDGGSNQHANSAFLGRHIRNNFPMHILGEEDEPGEVTAVGPLCTPTDVVGQKVILANAVPGDILVVEKSGAYGLTNSPNLFLGHPLPAEIIAFEGKTQILRERATTTDILKNQRSIFS